MKKSLGLISLLLTGSLLISSCGIGDNPPYYGIDCTNVRVGQYLTTAWKCTAQLTPTNERPPQGHCKGVVVYVCADERDTAYLTLTAAGGVLEKAIGTDLEDKYQGYRLDYFCSDTKMVKISAFKRSHSRNGDLSNEVDASVDSSSNDSDTVSPGVEPQDDPSLSDMVCQDTTGWEEKVVPGTCSLPTPSTTTISDCVNCLALNCYDSYCSCFTQKDTTCLAATDCFLNGNTYPASTTIAAQTFSGCMQLNCSAACPSAPLCTGSCKVTGSSCTLSDECCGSNCTIPVPGTIGTCQ